MTPTRQVREVVGQRVRELREQAGIRQQDLAEGAYKLGLPWNRSRIAAVERGEKPITVEDLVLLVALLTAALGRPIAVSELFDVEGSVALSRTAEIPARCVAEVLRGSWSGHDINVRFEPQPAAIDFTAAGLQRHQAILKILNADQRVGHLEDVSRSVDEADERAQRSLGEELGVYLSMCQGLWGRSLAAERDNRLQADGDLNPASLAARRGRVTRELLAELRELQSKVNTATENPGLGQHPATT